MNAEKKYQDLIIRSLTGELTGEENRTLQEWLDAAEENRKKYEETVFLWETSQVYQKANDREKERDWHIISERLQVHAEKRYYPTTGKKHPGKIREFLKIAAIFIAAFTLAWFVYRYQPGHSGKKQIPSYCQVITTKGQKARVILPDNTVVWLNAESRLEYPVSFNNHNRQVMLSGEAYFQVTKTADRNPFLVKTSDLNIRVTGTRFNVKAYPEEDIVETTLIDGSVTLLRKTGNTYQAIKLKPDQKATLIKKGANIRIDDVRADRPTLPLMSISTRKTTVSKEKIIISPDVNIKSHTAWKNEELVFESESFEDIAYQLERWFDVHIVFKDASLKKYCYTGKFIHKESLEQILNVIQMTTPFQYKIDKNNVIIYK